MRQLVVGDAVEVGVHVDADVGEKRLRNDPRPVHGDAEKQGGVVDAAQFRRVGGRPHRAQITGRPFAVAVAARGTLVAKLKHRHQRGAVRVGPDHGQRDRRHALPLPNRHAPGLHAMIPHRTKQHVVRHMHRARLAVKPNLAGRLVRDVPRPALNLRRRGGIEQQLHLRRVNRQRHLDGGRALGRDGDRRLGRSKRHAGVGQGVAHHDGAGPRLVAQIGQLDVALGQVRPGHFQQAERQRHSRRRIRIRGDDRRVNGQAGIHAAGPGARLRIRRPVLVPRLHGGVHQRRLDGGRHPVRVPLDQQRRRAGDMRGRHRGAAGEHRCFSPTSPC